MNAVDSPTIQDFYVISKDNYFIFYDYFCCIYNFPYGRFRTERGMSNILI